MGYIILDLIDEDILKKESFKLLNNMKISLNDSSFYDSDGILIVKFEGPFTTSKKDISKKYEFLSFYILNGELKLNHQSFHDSKGKTLEGFVHLKNGEIVDHCLDIYVEKILEYCDKNENNNWILI